jgi:hypothetical protein
MTSVSLVDWNIEPRFTSSCRIIWALVRLPLCATAKPPKCRSPNSGCTLRSEFSPVVE